MRFAPLEAAVALAGLGTAFLLPPTSSTSAAGDEIISILPFEGGVEGMVAEGRVMEVGCPGCPVAITDVEGNIHFSDVENILKLNFSIAHNGADQLMLNGLQIYPIDSLSQAFMEPLTADQIAKVSDDIWAFAATPRLGYSLSVKHPVQAAEAEPDLVAIRIEIVEVANKFINGIPSVELKLLETSSGKLLLGDAQIVPSMAPVSETTIDEAPECTTLVCKWRATIADRLSKLKGCGRKARPGQIDGPKHQGQEGHTRPHVRPHGRPHGGHGPHRHHRNKHGIARFLRNVAVHVLIPILVGVIVGIVASIVGMVVGNIVVFVWRAVFRRGDQAQYIKVQQEDGDTKSVSEKQGPPPTYFAADVKVPE